MATLASQGTPGRRRCSASSQGGPVAADGPRLMGIIKAAAAMPRRGWLFCALDGVVRDEFGGML